MTTPLARATAGGIGTGPAPMSSTGCEGRMESSGSSSGMATESRRGSGLWGFTALAIRSRLLPGAESLHANCERVSGRAKLRVMEAERLLGRPSWLADGNEARGQIENPELKRLLLWRQLAHRAFGRNDAASHCVPDCGIAGHDDSAAGLCRTVAAAQVPLAVHDT